MLESMVNITQGMLESAQNENWTELQELEGIRADLIQQLFKDPLPSEHQQMAGDLIRQTIDMNQELTRLCLQQRETVSQSLGKLRQGQKLRKTYEPQG